MRKITISASSLSAGRNMSAQIEFIQRVSNFGADAYHLDVMDGKFVKFKTIDYTYFNQLQSCSTLLLDTHLNIFFLPSISCVLSIHVARLNRVIQ